MYKIFRLPLASLFLGLIFFSSISADQIAFESPDDNSNGWGGWVRGDVDTLYAQWEFFNQDLFQPVRDTMPDVGSANTTLSIVEDITVIKSAQVTGSGNIYNLNDLNQLAITISGNGPSSGPVQVVVQIATLGSVYDYLRLEGNDADQIIVLRSEEDTFNPPGQGETPLVIEEILFIWNLDNPLSTYNFEFLADDTSLSFDSLAVDIGPKSIIPTPTPTEVPLPTVFLVILALCLGFIGLRRFHAMHE